MKSVYYITLTSIVFYCVKLGFGYDVFVEEKVAEQINLLLISKKLA